MRNGEPFIWLTGAALTLSVLLVVGLIGLILWNGLGFFWPRSVVRLHLSDGKVMTGQIVEREPVPAKPGEHRLKLKVANRDLYGADFLWVEESRDRAPRAPAGRRGDRAHGVGTPHRRDQGDPRRRERGGDRARGRPTPSSAGGCPRRAACAPRSAPSRRGRSARSTTCRRGCGSSRRAWSAGASPPGPRWRRSRPAWPRWPLATSRRRAAWPRSAPARPAAWWWRPTAARRRSCRWPR